MIIAQSRVSDTAANGFDGISNSVILRLVEGDIINIGDCTGIDTFYKMSQFSFSGFLLHID